MTGWRQFVADARFYCRLSGGLADGRWALLGVCLCNRGLWLLTFHRLAQFCVRNRSLLSPLWWLARALVVVGGFFGVVLCRSQILSDCEVSGEIYLANGGFIICGARRIGRGSLIHDHCTLGQAPRSDGRPAIGCDVWVGSHSIIAGSITIGDGATILPYSFVTFDVPARAVAKGNPARIIQRDFDNSALRSRLTKQYIYQGL